MTAGQILFFILLVFMLDRFTRRRALKPARAKVYSARSDRCDKRSRWARFWDDADDAVNSMGGMEKMEGDFFGSQDRDHEDLSREELLQKLAVVEERLDVLERIVTDKGYGLSEEINRL